jgi:peptide/nickel transport system permease protein
MLVYVVRRTLAIIPLLLGVVFITMLLPQLIPGDVLTIMLGGESVISPERADHMREMLGLNRSLPEQYWDYLTNLLRGDMGNSLRTGRPVAPIIFERFYLTAYISFLAVFLGALIGIPLGVIAARFQRTRLDIFLRIFNLIGLSVPRFWIGTMLLLVAMLYLRGVFPTVGAPRGEATILDYLRYAFLPSLTLAFPFSAVVARVTQSSISEVLVNDYVRTARSKGVQERVVFFKHALRNGLIPVVTVIGLQIGFIFGGIVEVEVVFAYPGVGTLALNAIDQRDYPMLQGILLIITVLFAVVNLLTDLSYAWLNPQITYD